MMHRWHRIAFVIGCFGAGSMVASGLMELAIALGVIGWILMWFIYPFISDSPPIEGPTPPSPLYIQNGRFSKAQTDFRRQTKQLRDGEADGPPRLEGSSGGFVPAPRPGIEHPDSDGEPDPDPSIISTGIHDPTEGNGGGTDDV